MLLALALSFGLVLSPCGVRHPTRCSRQSMPSLSAPVPNEFARPLSVASVERRATRHEISATPEECLALASRFDLVSIGGISANVSLSLVDKRSTRVKAAGKLEAVDVVRSGLSGGTHNVQVRDVAFETFFRPEEDLDTGKLDPSEPEAYDEAIENGQVDVGELVAQHLYLYLHDLWLDEEREWEDAPEGSVVYDSDPD